MAAMMNGNCLFNCLKEVCLEKFHRNFVERGFTNCDQLGQISMDQYSQFGIMSMDDRKRLFKIIETIKSIQKEGQFCQHGHGTINRSDELSKPTTVMNGNLKQSIQPMNVTFAPKKLMFGEAREKQNQGESKVFIKPIMGQNYKVRFEHSAEEDLKPKAPLQFGKTQKIDSPIHCRKALNFSGPDFYSDEEPSVDKIPISSAQPAPVPRVASVFEGKILVTFGGGDCTSSKAITLAVANNNNNNKKLNKKLVPSNGNGISTRVVYTVASSDDDCNSLRSEKPAYAFSQGNNNCNSTTAREVNCITTNGTDIVSIRSRLVPSDGESALVPSDGESALCQNDMTSTVGNEISREGVKVDLFGKKSMTATAFASTLVFNSKSRPSNIVTKETVSDSRHFFVNKNTKKIEDSQKIEKSQNGRTTSNGVWPLINQQSKNGVDKNHSYFPLSESDMLPPKPVHIEEIPEDGRYNYGIPGANVKVHSSTTEGNKKDKSSFGVLYPDKIRVCVRKRPRNSKEVKRNEIDIIKVRGRQTVVVEEYKVAVDLTKYIQRHPMTYDEVFDDKCSNKEVYDRAVKPLINSVFEKGSAICFAFGQTGAGKTHTLMGSKTVPGLYQLAGEDLFALAHSKKFQEPPRLWVSFYEIYCGHLYDLLNKRKRLHVRENGKQKVCVTGLMENPVPDVDSLIKVINYGNSYRSRGSTGVNPHSSRSHAILQMDIRDFADNRVGRMTFIDLAGSERASDAKNFDRQTRIEGAEINQSLLALKECIRSIDQESGHTPYRQSKLTHILRDSFLGNSRTVMIANIAPTQSACENTLNTLRYAQRVQEIRTEVARRSGSPSEENFCIAASCKSPAAKKSAPSLFHPSDIQFSSTPLKGSTVPVAIKNILDIGDESPISGHKFGGRKKSQEKFGPIAISPITEVRKVHYSGDSDIPSSQFGDTNHANDCGLPTSSANAYVACSSQASSSPDRSISEERKAQHNEDETNPPHKGYLEDSISHHSLTDFTDELLEEHRKIKSHAEMVMSKAKFGIENAFARNAIVQDNSLDQRIEPARAVFLETKLCMENARDNIRDFLDNERKSRMAIRLSATTQQQINTGPEKAEDEQLEVQKFNERTSDDNVSNSSVAIKKINNQTNAFMNCMKHMETSDHFSVGQTPGLNGNTEVRFLGMDENNCSTYSLNNSTKDTRSWATILQSSNGNGKIDEEPVLRNESSDHQFDAGMKNRHALPYEKGVVQNDQEPTEGDDEAESNVVISEQVRLLQSKIVGLKLQQEQLQRQQRLFDKTHRIDRKETILDDSHESLSSSVPHTSGQQGPPQCNRVLPAGNDKVSPEVSVYSAIRTTEMQVFGLRSNATETLLMDQNTNISKLSKHSLPFYGGRNGIEIIQTYRNCNNSNDHQSNSFTQQLSYGGIQTVSETKENDEKQKETDNPIGRQCDTDSWRMVQEISVSTEKGIESSAYGLANEYMSISHSKRQLDLVTPEDVEINDASEWGSVNNRNLQTEVGFRDSTHALYKNSAFSKVVPSTNTLGDNLEVMKSDKESFEVVDTRQTSAEIVTTVASLPAQKPSDSSFQPIKSFPITQRTDTDFERNNEKIGQQNRTDCLLNDQHMMAEAVQELTTLDKARNLLVSAHEDQLTAVTQLCKREMALLMGVRTSQMSYDQYMENVRDILSTKSKIILALMEHINEFHMLRH